jgi:hypothetical protein
MDPDFLQSKKAARILHDQSVNVLFPVDQHHTLELPMDQGHHAMAGDLLPQSTKVPRYLYDQKAHDHILALDKQREMNDDAQLAHWQVDDEDVVADNVALAFHYESTSADESILSC